MEKTESRALTPSEVKKEAEAMARQTQANANGHRNAIVGAMEAAAQNKPIGPVPASTPAPALAANESLETTEEEELDGAAAMLQVDTDLIYILSTPRGHDGKTEKAFCNWILSKLNKQGLKPELMEEGAIFVRVGEATDSKTLFSCHVDTVHSATEVAQQRLVYDPNFQHIMLERPKSAAGKDPKWTSNYRAGCLGADDGAGVWVLLKMIEAGIKGGYLFHRGEERGCISSHAIASKRQEWLKQWNAAIAFDRPKDFEVIYRQSGADCASKEYADALAKAFNANPAFALKMESSPSGGTTDTRNYRFIIPECINVAVGYYDHHSADEALDYGHLSELKDMCLVIDWEALPITRDPSKAVSTYPQTGYPYRGGYGGYDGYYGEGGWHDSRRAAAPNPPGAAAGAASQSAKGDAGGKGKKITPSKEHDSTLQALYDGAKSYEDIIDWFEMDPDLTAKAVMLALIEGRNAQIQFNMLLSKTLKAKDK